MAFEDYVCCDVGRPNTGDSKGVWVHHAVVAIGMHSTKDVYWEARGVADHPVGLEGVRGLAATWEISQMRTAIGVDDDPRDSLNFACRILRTCDININRLRSMHEASPSSSPCQLLHWERNALLPRTLERVIGIGLTPSYIDDWFAAVGDAESLDLVVAVALGSARVAEGGQRDQLLRYISGEPLPDRATSRTMAALLGTLGGGDGTFRLPWDE